MRLDENFHKQMHLPREPEKYAIYQLPRPSYDGAKQQRLSLQRQRWHSKDPRMTIWVHFSAEAQRKYLLSEAKRSLAPIHEDSIRKRTDAELKPHLANCASARPKSTSKEAAGHLQYTRAAAPTPSQSHCETLFKQPPMNYSSFLRAASERCGAKIITKSRRRSLEMLGRDIFLAIRDAHVSNNSRSVAFHNADDINSKLRYSK